MNTEQINRLQMKIMAAAIQQIASAVPSPDFYLYATGVARATLSRLQNVASSHGAVQDPDTFWASAADDLAAGESGGPEGVQPEDEALHDELRAIEFGPADVLGTPLSVRRLPDERLIELMRQCLGYFLLKYPTEGMMRRHYEDTGSTELQEFCLENAVESLSWVQGIAILDAARALASGVQEHLSDDDVDRILGVKAPQKKFERKSA